LHPLKVCILNLIEELRARRISKGLNSKLTFVKGEEHGDEFVREAAANITENDEIGEQNIEDVVNEETHTVVVIFMLSSIALISMCVTDLTIVYGIIAAFSESFINLILSGLFLMCTEYNFQALKNQQSEEENGHSPATSKLNYFLKMILGLMLTLIGIIHFCVSLRLIFSKLR